MVAQREQGLTGILGMSNADVGTLQSLAPYFTPMVSPWLTLGAGTLMGVYGHQKAKEDRARAIKLNAKLAELAPYTGVQPQQMSFENPNLLASVLGGIGTAQGVAGSINQFSPIYNAQRLAGEEKAARLAAEELAALEAQEQADILAAGGPMSQAAYDATLEPDITQHPFYDAENNPNAVIPAYRGRFIQGGSPYEYMEPSYSLGVNVGDPFVRGPMENPYIPRSVTTPAGFYGKM